MAIVTSKFKNIPLNVEGALLAREHRTMCPNGFSVGRIDHFTVKSMSELASRVRRRIIKDGSEFGKGEYVTTVIMQPDPWGTENRETVEIRFTI